MSSAATHTGRASTYRIHVFEDSPNTSAIFVRATELLNHTPNHDASDSSNDHNITTRRLANGPGRQSGVNALLLVVVGCCWRCLFVTLLGITRNTTHARKLRDFVD